MDEAYKERVYRLVYAVSQFPILRMGVEASVATSDERDDRVASVLGLLWGTGQTRYSHLVMSTLQKANVDEALRRLVDLADLKRVLTTGVQTGFYLSANPSGLRSRSTLQSRRSEALPFMVPESSRTEALNDRLGSANNPLWFVAEAQRLAATTTAFVQKQREVLASTFTELLDRGASEDGREIEQAKADWLLSGAVTDRASMQFLCAELAMAVGLLQVVVLDDPVEGGKLKSVSTNALRFRNAFAGKTTAGEIYEEWKKQNEAHDRVLRVLKKLVEACLLKKDDDENAALLLSIAKIEAVNRVPPNAPLYRGVVGALRDLGRTVRKGVTGGGWSTPTPQGDADRYAQWLSDYTDKLHQLAGKVFVFYLPEGGDKKLMRPGSHLYSSRDGRPGEDDKGVIEGWIGALLNSGVEAAPYSPVEQKAVDNCTAVFERAADMLGIKGGTQKEMVALACNTSGSCLDKQYLKVRDDAALKDDDDRSNALARQLLAYNNIECGGKPTFNRKSVEQILCEQRVHEACRESGAACGATEIMGDTLDERIQGVVKEVCDVPRSRKRVSAECKVPDRVDGDVWKRQDAECVRRILKDGAKEVATCKKELEAVCDDGREGACLLEAIEQRTGPDACLAYDAAEQAREVLREFEELPAEERVVCKKLMELTSDKVGDERMRELAGLLHTKIECGKNKRLLHDGAIDWEELRVYVDTMKGHAKPLPGGLAVSSDEYAACKRAYSAMRRTTPTEDQLVERISTMFDLIEVQCSGMEDVDALGIRRYRHRMLFDKFHELRDVSPIYRKVVGVEYVDWMLMVANHYTEKGWGRDSNVENLGNAIKAMASVLNKPNVYLNELLPQHRTGQEFKTARNADATGTLKRGRLFMDKYVQRYMYNRLAEPVKTTGSASSLRLSLQLIVELNECSFVKEATKGRPDMDVEWKKLFPSESAAPPSVIRNVSPYAVEELNDDAYSRWWREVLVMTLFAPRSPMAFDSLESGRLQKLGAVPWNVLYASLVCISVSSPEIASASTPILQQMSDRRNDAMESDEKKIGELVPRLETYNDAIDNRFAFQVFSAYAQLVEGYMKGERKKPLNVSTYKESAKVKDILDDSGYDGGVLAPAQLLFAFTVGLKGHGSVDRNVFLAKAMYLCAALSKETSGQMKVYAKELKGSQGSRRNSSSTAYSPAVAMAWKALKERQERFIDTIRGYFGSVEEEDAWSKKNLATSFFVTERQDTLLEVMPDLGKQVVQIDAALTLLLTRYNVYNEPIPSSHLALLSELVHVARLGEGKYDARSHSRDDESGLKLKEVSTFGELLPSERLPEDIEELSDYDAALVYEYAQALAHALTAYLTCRATIQTDEGFCRALFYACFPSGTFEIDPFVYCNPTSDVPFTTLFEGDNTNKELRDIRRLNVWALRKRRKGGIHYFALTKSDATDVKKLAAQARIAGFDVVSLG